MKRIISIVLVLTLFLSIISTSSIAFAEQIKETKEESLSGKTEELLQFSCSYNAETEKVTVNGSMNHDAFAAHRESTLVIYAINPGMSEYDIVNDSTREPLAETAVSIRFGFSFKIASIAIPLFGIGFLITCMKQWKLHDVGEIFMGFGMLFYGLSLLSASLKLSPESVAFIQGFSNWGVGGLLLGVLIGAVITALIHSSSAMTAIVLTMAANGSLTWEFSAAVVLGSNIGSTIDAILSAIGSTTNAKRAALVHVGFNVAGTVLALIVFKPFLALIDFIVPKVPADNITTHIAMLHTIFNLCCTSL